MEFLFLSFIDLSHISSILETTLVITGCIAFDFFMLIVFPRSFKRRNTEFWYEQDEEDDQGLPYNKNNLIQKWFLCRTRGFVPMVIRIIYIIKNITLICAICLSVVHIIFYTHILSRMSKIAIFIWFGLYMIVGYWFALRCIIKQYTNKP